MRRAQLAKELIAAGERDRRTLLAEYAGLADVRLAEEIRAICHAEWTSEPVTAQRAADVMKLLARIAPVGDVKAIEAWVHGISFITKSKFEAAVDSLDEASGLRTALSDPSRSPADKSELLRTLFDGKLLPATMLLVEQAAAGTHGAIDLELETFQHTAAQAIGEKIATVHAARELSDSERSRLADALGAQYDTTIHLLVVLDPDIVGGVRVEIGDDIIDGTVASKIEDAQRKLAG